MSIAWRPAKHADGPRILELWDEQGQRFDGTGVGVDRPQLFSPEGDTSRPFYPYCFPVMHVAVAEENGRVMGFQYTECIPEVCVVTGSREVMRTVGTRLTEEALWAKQEGFRSGWGLIPKKFIGAFAHFLKRYPHIRPWKSLTPVGINFQELGD